jgi:hypothetical protein
MYNFNNSFAPDTNVQWGSNYLPELWQNAQTFLIPNIALSHPEIGGRAGARLKRQSDTATFSPLLIDIMIDSDWIVYDILYQNFLKGLNVEEGTFSSTEFDIWLSILDQNAEEKAKWTFHNCRVTDISELNVGTINEDELLKITITLDFDYLTFTRN